LASSRLRTFVAVVLCRARYIAVFYSDSKERAKLEVDFN